MNRTYDLVLFGATGFTGRLVAEHLARRVPEGRRWAIAGRDGAKLEELRERIEHGPGRRDVGLVIADVGDPRSLAALARSTRVLLSAVGPYARYGEPVVRACVEHGTHHLDITGEPSFLSLLEEKYDAAARAKGVRLINCCGLDSIPADVGAYYTVQQLPAHEEKTVRGYLATNARPSGGTVRSALSAISEGEIALAMELIRPVGDVSALRPLVAEVHRIPEIDGYGIPMPLVDAKIVARSMKVHAAYGPRFQYAEYFHRAGLPSVAAALGGVLGLVLAAKARPTRSLLEALFPVGEGPTAAARARGWFEFTFVGESPSKKVVTRISGGDPGYDEASKMFAECGLALVEDEARLTRELGVLSPVGALGDVLVSRLAAQGIRFEVLAARTKAANAKQKAGGSDALRAN